MSSSSSSNKSKKKNNKTLASTITKKLNHLANNLFLTSSSSSSSSSSSNRLPRHPRSTAADTVPPQSTVPFGAVLSNEQISTPLKTSKSSSSSFSAAETDVHMNSTPLHASTSSSASALCFETPKEQIRVGFVSSGIGGYDWSTTTTTADDLLLPFQHLLSQQPPCNDGAPAPAIAPAHHVLPLTAPIPSRLLSTRIEINYEENLIKRCRNDSSVTTTTNQTSYSSSSSATVNSLTAHSKVQFITRDYTDALEPTTTEEEISFTLSQDMELESSQESPLFESLPSAVPLQRCVSVPIRPASRVGRRRAISVEQFQTPSYLNFETAVDFQDSRFRQYRSPKSSSVNNRRKRQMFDGEECEDHRPLCSSSCSDYNPSSRCTSNMTLDSLFTQEANLTTPSNHGPGTDSFGSMLAFSPNIHLESLELTQTRSPSSSPIPLAPPISPPRPMKRSQFHEIETRARSAPTFLDEDEIVNADENLENNSPPRQLSNSVVTGASCCLFTPPRNRRGRSDSYTDEVASTLPNYIPAYDQSGPGSNEHNSPLTSATTTSRSNSTGVAMFTPILSSRVSSSSSSYR